MNIRRHIPYSIFIGLWSMYSVHCTQFENMENIEGNEFYSAENGSTSHEATEFNLSFGTSAKLMQTVEIFLTTGCKSLDVFLKGGLATKGITQIYGASGTGKTQLALQLCLTVQLPILHGGLDAGAAYICTESIFPSKRLQELLQESPLSKRFKITGDLIFVEHVSDVDDLTNCITQKIPCLLSQCKIKLLIIDSITAPYRGEYSNIALKARAKSLRAICYQLHNLSNHHNMTILCVNQVSAVVSEKSGDICEREQPALGIPWANGITNNIYLRKSGSNRFLHVMQSSYLPATKIQYTITSLGVTAISKNT